MAFGDDLHQNVETELMSKPRYIDPTTDFGFKRIFGTETNKDLLIAFLNGVFRGRKDIRELYYNKNEHVGDAEASGSVIFDLTCTADDGEKFIIEVQRSSHINLKRRMLYYGSKLITDQAPKGKRREWGYRISEVYVIVLMDCFAMPDSRRTDQCLHDICLCDRDTGEIFYNDLGFIYLELANFVMEESEIRTDLEGWLFVLKNMSKLAKIPVYLRKPIFEKLFNIAEYSKLSKEERDMFDKSLKRKWDNKVVMDYHREEGRAEGRAEGIAEGIEEGAEQKRHELIINLIRQTDFDDARIASLTDATPDIVRMARAELRAKE